jgi:hypothetical protein
MYSSPKHIRNSVRYNSVGLFLTDSPGISPEQDSLNFLNRVQNASFSVTANRQNIPEIGSDDFLARKIITEPTINLNFNYFLTDGHDEYIMGLNIASGTAELSGTIHDGIKEDKNAFMVVGKEAFDLVSYDRKKDLGGLDSIGFGNCFITNYSVQASVGSFAQASVSMVSSNVVTECVGDSAWEGILKELGSVVLNLNNDQDVFLDLEQDGKVSLQDSFQKTIYGGVSLPSLDLENKGAQVTDAGVVFEPFAYKSPVSAIAPGGISIEIDNLEVGGPIISGDFLGKCSRGHANLQSFQINAPLERENLYGFESMYVYGRRLKFPQVGTVSIELMSSAFESGNMKDREYNIAILLNNSCKISCLPSKSRDSLMKYIINNAKFDSYTVNTSVGSRSTVTCNFSFAVSKEKGLYASGSYFNWKDDDCKLTYKHTPDGLEVNRVLEERDDANIDIDKILDDTNRVEVDVEEIV